MPSASIWASGRRGSGVTPWVAVPNANVFVITVTAPKHVDNVGVRADIYFEWADDASGAGARPGPSFTYQTSTDATADTDISGSTTIDRRVTAIGAFVRGRAEVSPANARFGVTVDW